MEKKEGGRTAAVRAAKRKGISCFMKRAVSVILTAAMTVSLCPFPAGAAGESEKTFHIEEFAEIPDDTAHISVTPGTPVEEVEALLPSKLTVRGYWDTEEEKATPSQAEKLPVKATPSELGDTGSQGNTDTGHTLKTEKIRITWEASPVYDGDTKGEYDFYPVIGDIGTYVVEDESILPHVTVTVKPKELESKAAIVRITGFEPLDTEVQNRLVSAGTEWDALALPAVLEASGYQVNDAAGGRKDALEHTAADGTEPVGEPLTVEGITWEIDPENPANDGNSTYTPALGSYCLTPVLPQGYELGTGVELPEIYVMIDGQVNNLAYGLNTYSKDDVEVVNAIIENNGLSAAKDDPEGWDKLVIWDSSIPKRITKLDIFDKSLTGTLDVSGLTSLISLDCSSNQLTELTGLSDLTSLISLDCDSNQLTGALNVSGLTSLIYLDCSSNQLTELTGLSDLTSLFFLFCDFNELTGTLDVSSLTRLISLNCGPNQLTELEGLDNLTNLISLCCYKNSLTELEGLGSLTSLISLDCGSNQLTALEGLDNLMSLIELYCDGNRLTALNVSGLTSLTELYCDANQLASLKLSDRLVLTVPAVAGGTVMLTGYTHSTKAVELTATADSGYTFEKWTKDGALQADITDNPVTITLDGEITLTPVYAYVLTGTVEISGTLKYDQQLTAAYSGGNNTGALSYQWKRGDTNIDGAVNTTYTTVEADIGQTLTCVVTSSAQTGSVSGGTAGVIAKADGLAVQGVSVVNCTTASNNDGKLTGVTADMEYKKSDAENYTDGTGSEITDLVPGEYRVRVKETATNGAGAVSSFTVTAYKNAPVTTYTVTFNANGGSVSQANKTTGADKKLGSLPTPARNGNYRFDGWFTQASGGIQVTADTVITGDTTIYAQWTYIGESGSESESSTGSGSSATTTTPGTTTRTEDGGSITSSSTTSSAGTTVNTQVKRDAAGQVTEATAEVTAPAAVTQGQNGQANMTVNVDVGAVAAAVTAAAATVELDIKLPVETIKEQLLNPLNQSVHVDVQIPSAVTQNAAAQVTDISLAKDVVEAAKTSGKDLTVTIKDEKGNVSAQWTFDGKDLKTSGNPVTDVNLQVRVVPLKTLTGNKEDIKAAVSGITGTAGEQTTGLNIDFGHSGLLPSAARIQIPAGNDAGIQSGDTVYLYHYNPVTKQLETLADNQYTVDAKGYVAIRLTHCSDYVLVPQKQGGTPSLL